MSKRIRFIVIIVSCSLAGILLFQGYWLYNSYLLSAERFDREVADVMKRLERTHALADVEAMGLLSDSTAKDDIGRLAKMVDFLLSGPRPYPDSALEDRRGNRKFITESKMMLTYRDDADTSEMPMHIGLDSMVAFTARIGDSVVGAPRIQMRLNKPGQLFALNTSYDYSQDEFSTLNTGLAHEVDSLLRSAGIGSPFAIKLSNFNGKGDAYVSDSTLFGHRPEAAVNEVKIGLLKPFRLTLAVANDVIYILNDMLWVLLASLAIVGITAWAFVAMLRTIFQQKRLSAIKSDFINNMTHEFKTPIATVSLAVEAMKNFDVMDRPEQAKEYLDICDHELKRISVMVEKVLKMAAFERLDLKLSLQKADIGKLVHDVVENMRPQWEKKAAKLAIKAENDSVEAMVDQAHLANVVYNLIDNSLKYTVNVPEIEITYGLIGNGHVRLAVSDNGIGIPTAYRERVFENFFRVPTGNIHNAKGFGLGLGYVSTIVQKHQGNIDVKSTVGIGSTFAITFPVTPYQ
ncbi:Signal transduction histidine kinase [Parapedobacter koreensis]|uniref:histidine kinase n=2 Tax=Parapedobacter koreensis TaxID=332977 RepID=A0A1H7P3G9_9SPHI|nr:Signal transduction histidine kinase [Parapedobacter koreensis]